MSVAANLCVAGFTVIAIALALLSMRAWRMTDSPRLAWVMAGFGLFAVKGALLSVLLFQRPDWQEAGMIPALGIDLLALGSFYAAAFRG